MSTLSTIDVVYEDALAYAARGWHVLACQPGKKDPYFPLAPNAYKSATTDPDKIASWFERRPDINIGIAAHTSGLVIVDVDRRALTKKADPILAELDDHRTYKVTTGDGYHLYYQDPSLPRIPGKITDGIDLKWKGYVIAAPSLHPSGKTYRVTDDTPPAPFPTHLLGRPR